MAASSPSKTRARPSKWRWSMPATFTTAPFGASEPVRTAMPPTAWIGSDSGWITLPSGAGGSSSARFSAIGLAGDGEAVAVEQPGVEEVAQHHRDAADPVDVDHVVLAVRLGVGDVRHPRGDLVEVVEGQVDPRLGGDGEEVEDGVGGAAERHDDRDGVLERLLRHDLPGPDAQLEQAHDRLAGRVGEVVAAAVGRRRRRRAGQRHADRLGDRRHRVGGEHAGAGALARAGVALDGVAARRRRSRRRRGRRPPRTPRRCRGPGRCAGRAGSTRRRGTPTAG